MKVLAKKNLETAFDRMAQRADLFVPMQRGPQTGFYSWKTFDDNNDDLMLDILNVFTPPKHIVFPPVKDKPVNSKENKSEVEAKIIFGIRGCDVQAIDYLSEALANGGQKDYYQAHRDQTTIIASACYYPGPSCFCTSMGGNPAAAASADVIISDAGKDGYVWDIKTERGEIISALIADLLEVKEAAIPAGRMPERVVDWAGVSDRLSSLYEHPFWVKLSEPCPGCGICTYSCPTCHCSESQAANWKSEGYNFSCYESCMYRGQVLKTGQNNPRQTATERFRNRFLHKLEFSPQKYSRPMCTGCGRCIVLCPAGVSIVSVISQINEDESV